MKALKNYCLGLLCLFALSLLPIFLLNVSLARQNGVLERTNILASEWQERSRGITDGTSSQVRFKALRLNDRLPDIRGVVFGSSTAMAITQDMFPAGEHIYNFSTSGRMLPAIVGEIDYILGQSNRINLLLVPLEWSLGFDDLSPAPQKVDLSYPRIIADSEAADSQFPWAKVVADALSYPSVISLFRVLRGLATQEDMIGNAIAMFTPYGFPEYTCDGTVVKNFNIKLYRQCEGFAYDGSHTHQTKSNGPRMKEDEVKAATNQAMTPGLCGYCQTLVKTDAKPNRLSLARLADQAKEVKRRGGEAIFFMPPLLPGFEIEFLRRDDLGTKLREVKQILTDWANREGVLLVDAGRSELFGCKTEEFVEVHHARKECYHKVFDWIWKQPRTGAAFDDAQYHFAN